MEIPNSIIQAEVDAINGISGRAKKILRARLEAIEYKDVADLRNQVIEIMFDVCGAAADAAAAMAANVYDDIRDFAKVKSKYRASVPSSNYDTSRKSATAGAVRAMIESVVETGETDTFFNQLESRVGYEVKRASGECTSWNSAKDPEQPKYARVPMGAETCDFCIMLASRGAVYRGAISAGADKGHYHDHCDCQVVPVFKGARIEGYNPAYYKGLYEENTERKTPRTMSMSGNGKLQTESTIVTSFGKSKEYWQEAAKRAKEKNGRTNKTSEQHLKSKLKKEARFNESVSRFYEEKYGERPR